MKVIGFDADDTLWVNEPHYQEVEKQLKEMLSPYKTPDQISGALFETEMQNLKSYGYGAKGFMLSMIETAIKVSDNKISAQDIAKIIDFGKALINQPIELLDGVEETLKALFGKYTLILATKGDLLDQERKLKKSGLSDYFDHIEIMSNKKKANYQKLLKQLGITPKDFIMVGNSMKSDIIPVINIGAQAFHIPYFSTWAHEQVCEPFHHEKAKSFSKINMILKYL